MEHTCERNETRTTTLPTYEMQALVALLMQVSDHYSRQSCDDVNFSRLVPDLAQRRALMCQYHLWNGDRSAYTEDEALAEEYQVASSGALLHYFAHRLAPDVEQEFRGTEMHYEH